MNETKHNFNEIPAAACTLTVGEFELGDNGENAKSAPVKLVARSGQPIEHWFWGNVVHDLSGMRLHKPRLPIDYAHDSGEVIGYLNKFDRESGDLVTSGALVPYGTDRASEVMYKMREGVPYEASINFGGDGIKVQEIHEGEVTEVNGYQFEGPGIVVREWPLRGVAICPYGADMNTESAMAFSDNNKVFSASVVETEPEHQNQETAMAEPKEQVAEVEATEAEEKKVEELEQETVEATETEETVETVEETEEESVEVEEAEESVEADEETESEEVPSDDPMSRDEFARIKEEFGAEIAAETLLSGGDYSTALAAHAVKLADENKALREQVAELSENKGGTPAKVSVAKQKATIFNTGK